MENVIKLTNPNNTKTFRLFATEENEDIEVVILEGHCGYFCKIGNSDVIKFADQFQIEPAEYLTNLKQLITSKDLSGNIDIDRNTFSVYKNKKVKYFYKQIQKFYKNEEFSKIYQKIRDKIEKNNEYLKEETRKIKLEMEHFEEEKALYEAKLNEIKNSNMTEEQLIDAFLPALNEKKRIIRNLSKSLEGDQDEEIDDPANSQNGSETNIEESFKDDDDYETDDEINSRINEENGESIQELNINSKPSCSNILPKRVPTENPRTIEQKVSAIEVEAIAESTTIESIKSSQKIESQIILSTQDLIDNL